MNYKFDELAKGLAQSVTRRQAMRRFGFGIAGMVLACFGLANRGQCSPPGQCLHSGHACTSDSQCCSGLCNSVFFGKNRVRNACL
jgi:hypothetical protein